MEEHKNLKEYCKNVYFQTELNLFRAIRSVLENELRQLTLPTRAKPSHIAPSPPTPPAFSDFSFYLLLQLPAHPILLGVQTHSASNISTETKSKQTRH